MTDAPPSRFRMPRNVVLLGLVSLLTDVGSEMVLPLLPAFLVSLGGGARALGWIEGLADAVASVLRLVSGRWADRIGRNRPFVIAGYGIGAVARPLFALAALPWHVVAIRTFDRVGKGLRGSPRDALIAASVPAERRGAAFGLHRAMDHAGAFLGPLIAFAMLSWWTGDLRTIFVATAIPGALAVLVAVRGVREVPVEPATPAGPTRPARAPQPTRELWRFLLPVGLFTLGSASELFLLLKAGAERAPIEAMPLLWVALHAVKAALATPGGRIADRIGRRRTLAIGWTLHAAVFTALALVDGQAAVIGLILVHGARCALTEGAEKALVAEIAPKRARGAAFGWYHVVVGLLSLAGAVLFGELWARFGDPAAFGTAAGISLLAVFALGALRRA